MTNPFSFSVTKRNLSGFQGGCCAWKDPRELLPAWLCAWEAQDVS